MSIEGPGAPEAAGAQPQTQPDAGAHAPSTAPGEPLAQAAKALDGLEFVMDVPVELTVEIGRRTMRIGEILRLGTGSVLELDKAAGEPLDIFVNDRPIARGEAVVVGDRYGVRLTEVFVDESRGGKAGNR
jgi:flagellar motor switch protein FliN/FliY